MFCHKCGKEIPGDANFCEFCGESVGAAGARKDYFSGALDAEDFTSSFDAKDIQSNKIVALFSYIHILFLIPLLAANGSAYARFHTNQGLLLFICNIGWSFASNLLRLLIALFVGNRLYSLFSMLIAVGNLAFLIISIIGIVNAVSGKAKELPLIGRFRILK